MIFYFVGFGSVSDTSTSNTSTDRDLSIGVRANINKSNGVINSPHITYENILLGRDVDNEDLKIPTDGVHDNVSVEETHALPESDPKISDDGADDDVDNFQTEEDTTKTVRVLDQSALILDDQTNQYTYGGTTTITTTTTTTTAATAVTTIGMHSQDQYNSDSQSSVGETAPTEVQDSGDQQYYSAMNQITYKTPHNVAGALEVTDTTLVTGKPVVATSS